MVDKPPPAEEKPVVARKPLPPGLSIKLPD